MDYQAILDQIFEDVQPLIGQGKVADYIPALADADPMQFGMSITLNNGKCYGVGDYQQPFSIQSISKVFSFTLALRHYRKDLYKRVWREPSGDPFNSLVQLEYEAGIPRNPFINAGAIVVCDSLLSKTVQSASIVPSINQPQVNHSNMLHVDKAFGELLTFIREISDDDSIEIDQTVADSEMEYGFRNSALANLMKSFENVDNKVLDVLTYYFQQCSIKMNTQQLSRAFLYLANNGVDPISKNKALNSQQAKRVNSIMLTCGHYDASGDFAFRVGLPGKSGVGGGIVAIVPGKMAISVFSPGLNKNGNSVVGTKALEIFTDYTDLSIF